MAGKSKRPPLLLTPEEVQHLKRLRRSRKAPAREVQRAEILWRYHCGETIVEIMRAVKMTRKSVGKWIERALAMGVEAALKDAYHRPYQPRISEEAKAWVVHLACCKPKELGYAAELWTRSALARHVRQHAVEAGYPALAQAAKATVHRILAEQPLHPEKVKYYLERRDPDFESKMRQVLLVYREVAWQNESSGEGGPSPGVITVSVDEKPGVQAIANTAPDLPPGSGEASLHGSGSRIQTFGNLLDPGGSRLARRPGDSAGRAAAPQPRIHLIAEGSGPILPGPMHDPADLGQSLRSHIQGDEGLFADASEPLQIRAYADPRVLAEHCRDAVWEDGAYIPQAYPSGVLGGASGTNPAGDSGDQRCSGGSPLEEVRGARGRT